MELKNWQLIGIVVGAFAAILIIDLAMREEFRERFPMLNTAQFGKFRAPQMVAQEMSAVPFQPSAPTIADEDEMQPLNEED